MSLRAIVEIIVHLESFRNIDLFQQGLYFLQFEIFHSVNGKKFSASPYNICTPEINSKGSAKIPGQLEDIYFKSQTFYIKYCDEDIDINEISVFRTEVEVNNEETIPHLSVKCSLMYSDLGGRINDKVLKSLLENPPTFNPEASAEIKILNFIEGVNQFLPIIFDDSHFCLMNSTIHVILIDFRFRALPMLSTSEENTQMLNKNPQDKEINMPITLSEIFFPSMNELTNDLIDAVHQKYMRLLTIVYDKNNRLIHHWLHFLDKADDIMLISKIDHQAINSSITTDDSLQPIYGNLLSTRILDRDPAKVSEKILQDIQELAGNMHYLVHTFIDVLNKASKNVAISLMYEYNARLKDRWGESIFRKVSVVDDFCQLGEHNLGSIHKTTARRLRQSEYYRNMENIQISITDYLPNPEFHPIIFFDVYSKTAENEIKWEPH